MDIDEVPLTFQQEFYLEGVKGGHLLNCLIPNVYRLSGRLDTEILKKSIKELMWRHSALRTRITTVNGTARQHIDAEYEDVLERISSASVPQRDGESALRDLVEEIVSTDIDLARDRLFDVRLLKIADYEHVLILAIHHIIYDIHSLELLLRDLWRLFLEFYEGNRLATLDRAPQYCDYAVRQRRENASWIASHGRYWEERRSEFSPIRWPLEGHVSEARPAGHKLLSFSFDEEMSGSLRELARREKKPLAVVVLAIYVIAVARICNMNAFVMPINSLGHHHSSDSRTVGYFAYFLYLSVHIVKHGDFRAQLERIYRDFLMALSHQDFGRVATSAMEVIGHGAFSWGSSSRGKFGSAMEVELLQQSGIAVCPLRVVGVEEFPVPKAALAFNLFAGFTQRSENILGGVMYRDDIFQAKFIERLIEETRSVLHEAVARL